eukprot:4764889-Pyramimonas_sp.AAC.1
MIETSSETGVVSAAQRNAVLVCLRGPDPALIKSQAQPFYIADGGMTTISGSGVRIPATSVATAVAIGSATLTDGKVRRLPTC